MSTIKLILAAITALAKALKSWFGWITKKQKDKEDAADKTASKIGKGKPFTVLLLLFCVGCSYVYTVSSPMVFDANDFSYLEKDKQFAPQKDGYYFSYDAIESYVRGKICEYEVRRMGFFHKDKSDEN